MFIPLSGRQNIIALFENFGKGAGNLNLLNVNVNDFKNILLLFVR